MRSFNRPYDPEAKYGLNVMFPARTEDQIMEHAFELAYHANIGDVDDLLEMSRRRKLTLRQKLVNQKEEEKKELEKKKRQSGSGGGRGGRRF